MKIEKIELSGFKSFADKTIFHFHPGITGIVGPNGCGKSNLVDAFKWLFGEQSAKALRSNKMDEVIFNGSATKRSKGMAEVTVYISGIYTPQENGNGSGENNLTVITRRLYRSGESEYLINNNICRLKDIKDMLLDTGLDVKNYFIFEQERLIHLINVKPEERRFLIEEIAGVIKYKVKRAEAQAKLEQSRLNLQRINDIISEVKKQLNALQRQVKKAERYKRLSEERKNLEIYLLKTNFDEIRERLNSTLSLLNTLRYEEAQKKTEINTLDNTLEKKRLNLTENEKRLNFLYSELETTERDISENTKRDALIIQQIETLKKEIQDIEYKKMELMLKMDETHRKLHEIESMKDSILKERDLLKKRHDELTTLIETKEIEFKEIEKRLEDLRKDLFKRSEEQSRTKNELMRIEAMKEQLEKRKREIEKEIEDEETRIRENTIREETLTHEIKSIEEALSLLRERLDEFIIESDDLRKEMKSKNERLQFLKESLASIISRIESLKELLMNETSKEIFNEREGIDIAGMLSEFINVPERYEDAIESALSERINSFIIEDERGLMNAINLIKEKGITKTGFIVRDLMHQKDIEILTFPENKDLPSFTIAAEIVEVDERFREIINHLLKNTLIVDDMEDALKLKRNGFNHPIVTIQGEYIDNGGVIWSGKSREILKRKRELRVLEEKKEGTINEMELLNQGIEEIRRRISTIEREVSLLDEDIDRKEGELRDKRHSLESILKEKERLSKRVSYLRADLKESEEELRRLLESMDEKLKIIDEMESMRASIETEIEDIRSTQSKNRTDFEKKREEFLNIKLSINTIDERIKTHGREMENLKESLLDIEDTLKKLEEKKASLEKEIESLTTESSIIRKSLSELVMKAQGLKTEINRIKEEMESENQWFIEKEDLLKDMRNGLNELLSRLNELEVVRAQDSVRLDTIKENLRINYGIMVNDDGVWLGEDGNPYITDHKELKDRTHEEIIQRIEEIKKDIEELGLVNTGSIEEYDELKERYDFLMKQHEDLTKSISELEEAISKINATTRKRLREAFDALNAKFSEVFTTLFGGGRAYLSLTDEDNILESGIEIIAQPPGKRLQNINLLSGGEKALTAISLLFASFLLKPAPICILDETDAPLDEANIVRFANMIKELSDRIQFIIITHNKTTMTYCDYLYGVTMEEPGSSKIISIELVNIND